MQKILLSLLLILAQSTTPKNTTVLMNTTMIAGGSATPTFVQAKAGGVVSGTSIALTVSAVGANNGLFVYCIGQTAIVCNVNSTAAIGCSAVEFTSPSSGHAVDGTGGAGSATTAMSVATSGPNGTANDTCVGMAMGNVTSTTWTSGGGWTPQVNSSGNFFPFMESQSFAVAATETATGTAPGGTTAMTQGIISVSYTHLTLPTTERV